MKKLAFLMIVVLVVALSIPAVAQDGPNIAFFNPLGNNSYTPGVEAGIRDVVEAAGGTVEEFSVEFNAEEQLNQIEDAITSGNFDAFIIYAVDNVGVTVGADAAAEAGIPVIAVDAPINPDRKTLVPYVNVAGQIARRGIDDGFYIGNAIVMACEGMDSCEVGYLTGFAEFPLDDDRLAAVEDVLAEHAHIEIVSVQAASYLEDEGFAVSTDMLLANPEIDVIASVGDQMILGAELAVQDAGMEGAVALIGQGANIDGYNAVAEGRWFATVANIPFTNGQIAGQMALQAIEGDLILRSANMYDQSPPFPASGPIITQDNYEEFEPQW
jgi:ribose transport system substrate-binding protein